MSFWKSLFGGGGDAQPVPASGKKTAKSVEHNGYRIEAQPYPEAGQFQLAGTISKEIDGVRKEHRYVRADRFASMEDAAEYAILKGRQIVDQQGDRIFS
jgi:hypothetical protein